MFSAQEFIHLLYQMLNTSKAFLYYICGLCICLHAYSISRETMFVLPYGSLQCFTEYNLTVKTYIHVYFSGF
jgi:hypothetical protein